jgi:hypothetical protein
VLQLMRVCARLHACWAPRMACRLQSTSEEALEALVAARGSGSSSCGNGTCAAAGALSERLYKNKLRALLHSHKTTLLRCQACGELFSAASHQQLACPAYWRRGHQTCGRVPLHSATSAVLCPMTVQSPSLRSVCIPQSGTPLLHCTLRCAPHILFHALAGRAHCFRCMCRTEAGISNSTWPAAGVMCAA